MTPEDKARQQIDAQLVACGWVVQDYRQFTYRLIKFANACRVLFLVDRANLGRQAMAEFQQFVAPDTGRKFTEVYNVQHLTSNNLDSVARATICTIQRLYSILRGEELDEDLAYAAKDLDRSVVVKSQIRTVLQTFKDSLFTELFPGRTLVPKTLIFCKDDSHAEDTVHLVREVFGKGNDFAKKITYKTTKWQRRPAAESGLTSGETPLPPQKSETLIQEFRTSPQLRIAVTVDMIATGTDIKPLECLLFLRDTRSRTYFEQMKGRGTRVLTPTDLQAVSGADARAKTHFVIVDAVGVCESDKTDSRPLERQRTVPFDKLLLGVALGKRDEDTLTTLAGRLARLDREITRDESKKLAALSGGKSLSELSGTLLRAIDPDNVAAASRRFLLERLNDPAAPDDFGPPPIGYFDPEAPVAHLSGELPHWRQDGVTYFVTFRQADSLPQEKLVQWRAEMAAWQQAHPEPHDEATRQEFYSRFPGRLQRWLDAGYGSCILDIEAVHELVENALRHFDGDRYSLDEFVVAKNHVHVLVTPLAEHRLSDILHSWKSFTAHEILKVEAASRRLSAAQGNVIPVSYTAKVVAASRRNQRGSGVPPLNTEREQRRDASATLNSEKQRRDASATASATLTVWQKESFDHIVRSPASLEKFRQYIRAHRPESESGLFLSEDLRRDAAATLADEACAPFDVPALRDALAKAKQDAEQTIDTVTVDTVLSQGFDAAAKAKAAGLVQAFRDYLAQHQTEIDALQILYSRPFKQRLTEPMLKELEQKLRDNHAAWTEDRLWEAYALTRPGKVKGRSQAGRFADLVALVRFALEQQPVLAPFADSVTERFNEWLMDKAKQSGSGVPPLNQEGQRRDASATIFTPEQLAWLNLICNHIATSLSIEPDDLELSPFNQRGGLGKAHQLFGNDLNRILNELNLTLVA